jgi:hypothetical protein
MMFEHTSYVPEGSPTLRVVIFVPHDEATIAKVAAAYAAHQAAKAAAASGEAGSPKTKAKKPN